MPAQVITFYAWLMTHENHNLYHLLFVLFTFYLYTKCVTQHTKVDLFSVCNFLVTHSFSIQPKPTSKVTMYSGYNLLLLLDLF